jgi:hypothetical protein
MRLFQVLAAAAAMVTAVAIGPAAMAASTPHQPAVLHLVRGGGFGGHGGGFRGGFGGGFRGGYAGRGGWGYRPEWDPTKTATRRRVVAVDHLTALRTILPRISVFNTAVRSGHVVLSGWPRTTPFVPTRQV